MINRFVTVIALALSSCVVSGCNRDISGATRIPPPPPFSENKTLWVVSDLPQVGTLVRLHAVDGGFGGGAYSDFIATHVAHDAKGYPSGDSSIDLTNNRSIKLGASFLGLNASASAASAKNINFVLKGVTVEQLATQQKLLRAIRDLAHSPDRTQDDKDVYTQISAKPGASEYTIWVITKVFTAESVDYKATSKSGPSASFSCDDKSVICGTVSAAKLNSSVDITKSSTGTYHGSNRPVYVVMYPVKENSSGSIYINYSATAPEAILQN